jgi:DNA polymerase III epsilon subunit-like protein
MRYIVFDIETKNTFDEVGSSDAAALDISVVCTYDSETGEYDAFWEDDFGRLWKLIEGADMLVGYNSDHFDIPLLNKYYPGDLGHLKSLDLLKEIKESLGRRLRLDAVAEATLGEKKSGHGLDAIKWWRSGELDKIEKYCLKDVEITKKVLDYALEHKHLKYKDLNKIQSIPLDTSNWLTADEVSLTQTLGF